MRVGIVGGGSAAHLLSVVLACRGHEVRVLTRRPSDWQSELELECGDSLIKGKIAGVGNDPNVVLANAEVAFLCMPVHQYPNALESTIPSLAANPECIVGTVYGQAGFNWMVKGVASKCGVNVPPHFAIGLLPWIARTKQYGARAISYGPKMRNGIATSSEAVFDKLQDEILDDLSYSHWGCGKFERVPNFLTLTLTVDNQIIHPSRCYALTSEGDGWIDEAQVPYFYREWDEYSAEILRGIDADYTTVRNKIFERYPKLDSQYNLNYLELEHWSYGSHNPDIKASFVNSTTLSHIKPPTMLCRDGKLRLDVNHRFFKDDFAYGLEICKWMANEFSCPVPHVDKLLTWYSNNIKPQQTDAIASGVPSRYGLNIDDVFC